MSYDEHLISMAGGDGEPTTLDLDAIQARASKATPGPWNYLDAQIRHTQIDGWTDPEGRRKAQEQTERDIQFVMNARTDVPALIALVRELEARLADAWDEGHAHYGRYFSPNFPEFGVNPYRPKP